MRTPSQSQKSVTGVISGMQIGIGALMSCLLFHPDFIHGGGAYALPILMSGILGLCAGYRKSASFGIYMGFCILSCVVALVYSILAFVWPIGLPRYWYERKDPLCKLLYAKVFFMALGGFVSLAGSIISCVVCCGKQSPDPRDVVIIQYSGMQATNLTRGQLPGCNQGVQNVQYLQYSQYSQNLQSPQNPLNLQNTAT